MSHSLEDDKFLCSIQRDSLDVILRWRIDKVENILMLLKNMHTVGDEILGMVEWLLNF